MIRLEIKKNIISFYFLIAVVLLYMVFLLGDSGQVLKDGTSTTIIQAIWSKFHGNWVRCASSSYLVRMNAMWIDNAYLPVLMPVICGFPSVVNYVDEIVTKNKRMMLIRCSFRKYYTAKIIANAITAITVSVTAVLLFYVTLLIGYDSIPMTDASFSVIYFVFSGKMIDETEKLQQLSMALIYFQLTKGVVLFALYSVMNSSFCFLIAVLLRDKYMVLGGTIAVIYLQCRIYGELSRKYLEEGHVLAGKAADILNPCFLYYTGSATNGFYRNKVWMAVLVALFITTLNYGIMLAVLKRQFDATER